MDQDGVDAEMLYPPQRAMLTFMKNKDVDAHLAGIRAYNRWLKDGFCAPDPERLIGIFQTPNVGIETAVSELERAKKRRLPWRRDLGVAVGWRQPARRRRPVLGRGGRARHARSASTSCSPRSRRRPPRRSKAAVAIGATAFVLTMPLITEMIFQGVFDRFPRLRMAAVETGVGWIPHFLEMTDDRWWRNRIWAGTKLKKVPSDYFRDHWLATFIVDRSGVAVRHQVGVDNMAWSTDFPHHGNDWPYSRKRDRHAVRRACPRTSGARSCAPTRRDSGG